MKNVLAMVAMLTVGALCPAFSHADGECKADIQKFCSDVQSGQGRIIACLRAHGPDLSPECKTSLKAAKEKIQAKLQAFQDACGADEKKLCGDVQPGDGRIKNCMDQHTSELSGACQAIMSPTKTPNPS